MSDITLVLLGAGNSTRFGLPVKKQWLWIGDEPLWLFVARKFDGFAFAKRIIVTHPKERPIFEKYCDYTVVTGGESRQASIANALQHVQTPYVLISDIARVCVSEDLVQRILDRKGEASCIAPAITPPDTVVYHNETLDRSKVLLIQTPQLSRTKSLVRAFAEGEFTDESSAIRAAGEDVLYIEGERNALKLTFKEDLSRLPCLKPPAKITRSGFGFDVHAFCTDRPLYLCGVEIPSSLGLAGHSDADVALHALIDALLGAAGFGDIGELFPDSDEAYAGIDSKVLLQKVVQLIQSCGFRIESVDITIAAQAPKLLPFKSAMASTVAKILGIAKHHVNIKATTTEKLGFVGRKEGIAAMATAQLSLYEWSES